MLKSGELTEHLHVVEKGLAPDVRGSAKRLSFGWCFAILLLGQSLWGMAPGISRHLQTEVGFDALVLQCLQSSSAIVILGLGFVRIESFSRFRKIPYLWLFVIMMGVRSACLSYAPRYTLGVFIQLINLSTPFLVSFVSRCCLGISLPKYTWPVIIICAIGSFLVLSGDLLDTGTGQEIDIEQVVGMVIAFGASCLNTFYYIFLTYVDMEVSKEELFCFKELCVLVTLLPISLFIDDWGFVLNVPDWRNYFILIAYILAFWLPPGLIQLQMIRYLGAPLCAATAPWRVVAAMALSLTPFILEPLTWTNILGVGVVFVVISFYLIAQYRLKTKQEQKTTETLKAKRKLEENGQLINVAGESTEQEAETECNGQPNDAAR